MNDAEGVLILGGLSMASVKVWKQPYAPGDPPLGTFSLERAAAIVGLNSPWLAFVLLLSERATGVWDTADWHIEGAPTKEASTKGH